MTSASPLCTLAELPKSHTFTSNLPADPEIPSPQASKEAPAELLRSARAVKGAIFTWVKPDTSDDYELLATSPKALHDLGLKQSEAETEEFAQVMSGNKIYDEHYPWAQCYGGWQFGSWAGQLGDGRVMSLFEATNPETKERYEVQLKGSGKTPYSRFADGNAVLRSSIREFLISEHLNALGIPSTRALSLVNLPSKLARRERIETCAVYTRFAPSWLRIGSFDIHRWRGDRVTMKKLADYCIEHVFGGLDKLPGKRETDTEEPNRFERLYREICARNAKTVAYWQAYGFMNGVLNTDNTSILGLSMDFGPFAFMDNFDPSHTPNHDDHALRYSYRMQPTIIWWNLTRLGEDLGELFGAGEHVDEEKYAKGQWSEEEKEALITRAEGIIERAGDEYKAVFLEKYKELMGKRLGLQTSQETDFDQLFSNTLDTLEKYGIDFHHFFYRISSVPVFSLSSDEDFTQAASNILPPEEDKSVHYAGHTREDAVKGIVEYLQAYKKRLETEGSTDDAAREKRMKEVNPKFTLRNWVLQEVIDRVSKDGERDILQDVMTMALNPYDPEKWKSLEITKEDQERYCGTVPRSERGLQCSCSS
ncbi:hypothetical protein YB2330_002098 [Saitoella coloradoensis]